MQVTISDTCNVTHNTDFYPYIQCKTIKCNTILYTFIFLITINLQDNSIQRFITYKIKNMCKMLGIILLTVCIFNIHFFEIALLINSIHTHSHVLLENVTQINILCKISFFPKRILLAVSFMFRLINTPTIFYILFLCWCIERLR